VTDQVIATLYVQGEGRASLDPCMRATFAHCRKYGIKAIVMYTANGLGPCLAVERYLNDPEYSWIRLVAVTPPAQRRYIADPRDPEKNTVRSGVFGESRVLLDEANVPIVSARLPFRAVVGHPTSEGTAPEGTTDPMQLVDRAFGILGGGLSLCVQAAMIACDAGYVAPGEKIATMTADTAIVVLASHTEMFLSPRTGLLVEHIICRPLLYDISKATHLVTVQAVAARAAAEAESAAELAALGPGDSSSVDPASTSLRDANAKDPDKQR
jgi:hypothetical protein